MAMLLTRSSLSRTAIRCGSNWPTCSSSLSPGMHGSALFRPSARAPSKMANGMLLTAGRRTFTAGAAEASSSRWSYIAFAKAYPNTNNIIIATLKTSAADLITQCVIQGVPVTQIDWGRNLVFAMFGAVYLGAFQYWYQVNVFKALFPNVERFTTQSVMQKLTDVPGLISLGAQVVLDLGMLTFVYLPVFYSFKRSVFSDSWNPAVWVQEGIGQYTTNFKKDAWDVFRVWAPADVLCFSVPLWLRLPVRHIFSFVWTAYLSFMRGAK